MRRTSEDILDEWLVLRCQSGEQSVLHELVTRWHPRLYRHARRLVDHADAADDVMQEAWLAIVRGLARLGDPARFGPWAYRIVTNKCRDWVRERVRQQATTAGRDGAAAAMNQHPDPAQPATDNDDDIRALRLAMRELSTIHRAALALYYLDGMEIAEIAVALGIPPGTVKSRLHHARERLRTTIEHNERIES